MKQLVFRTAGVQDIVMTDIDKADLERAATSGQLQALGIEAAQEAAPPNPYADDIAALRAASATPESAFEDSYKAARQRALDAERQRRTDAASPTPRLTTAELSAYTPPDPYTLALRALKEAKK